MSITLEAVQQLVDQLSPLDQVRLIAYLTQRMAPALETVQAPASTAEQARRCVDEPRILLARDRTSWDVRIECNRTTPG